MSLDKQVQSPSQKKPITSNVYVNTVLQPVSNTKSWSDDTITASPIKKQEPPRDNSWDTSASDDNTNVPKRKHVSSNLQKTQPFLPSTNNLTSSDSDNNSVETEIRRLDLQKPSNEKGLENLVNKQIGNSYKVIGLSKVQSPLSEDSSWTTSPVPPFNKESTTKGIQNLVQQPKSDESTWDDSRPLSADLKVINSSKVSTTGIENLIRIMDTIIQSTKKQTSSKVVGKLLVSSMVDRTDSIVSENTLHEVDNDEDYESMNSIFLGFFLFCFNI